VLQAATEKSDNPDLRDRGYIYWRLLAGEDPQSAKAVILGERPVISDDASSLDSDLLDYLTRSLSTLASVYHKPAEAFVRRARATYEDEGEEEEEEEEEGDIEVFTEALGNAVGGRSHLPSSSAAAAGGGGGGGGDLDLLGLGGGGGGSGGGGGYDFFGGGGGASSSSSSSSSIPQNLPELASKDGFTVCAAFARRAGGVCLDVVVKHTAAGAGGAPLSACVLKAKPNVLGLSPTSGGPVVFPTTAPGSSGYVSIPLSFSPTPPQLNPADSPPDFFQCAMRCNSSMRVMFFSVPFAGFSPFFTEEAPATSTQFVSAWRELTPEGHGAVEVLRDLPSFDIERCKEKLAAARVTCLTTRPGPDGGATQMVYAAAKGPSASGSPEATLYLFELTFKSGVAAIKVQCKTVAGVALAKFGLGGVASLLRA